MRVALQGRGLVCMTDAVAVAAVEPAQLPHGLTPRNVAKVQRCNVVLREFLHGVAGDLGILIDRT